MDTLSTRHNCLLNKSNERERHQLDGRLDVKMGKRESEQTLCGQPIGIDSEQESWQLCGKNMSGQLPKPKLPWPPLKIQANYCAHQKANHVSNEKNTHNISQQFCFITWYNIDHVL